MENTSSLVPSEPARANFPSASAIFGNAFAFYKANIKSIIAIGAVPFVLSTLGSLAGAFSVSLSMLFGILSFVASILALLAFYALGRDNGKLENGVSKTYARAARMFLPYAWILFLQNAAILGAAFLFIVPGIIFSILLGQATYALFLDKRTGIEALIRSWYYVRGHWWGVLWRTLFLGIIFFLANALIIAAVSFGLGGGAIVKTQNFAGNPSMYFGSIETTGYSGTVSSFFTNLFFLPFTVVYMMYVYQALKAIKDRKEPEEADTRKMRKTIKIFFGIAAVGVLIATIVFGALLALFIQHLTDPNYKFPEFMPHVLNKFNVYEQ